LISNEKTFVILTPGFPESEADTTCLPMQQSFVKTLKQIYPGTKIVVLSFQYPYHKNVYYWFDIKVIPFNGRNRGGLIRMRLRKEINVTLNEIFKAGGISGLLSFWSNECAWIGKKFADKHGIKHYCWVLGQDAKKENKYPKQLNFRPNELIALSDFIQDEFENGHGVRPQFVVPPGIDANLFDNSIHEKNIDILGVGSLIPLKQYEIFVEVVAALKKDMPGIKAVLVGKGPEKERLESLISKFDIRHNISLTGELAYPEVLKLMQRSKVFLHPSSYEGFGCVCLEALEARCHVISFARPMRRDIEQWSIVKTKEAMTGKSLSLLRDPKTNYRSIEIFGMADTVTSMMRLFVGS